MCVHTLSILRLNELYQTAWLLDFTHNITIASNSSQRHWKKNISKKKETRGINIYMNMMFLMDTCRKRERERKKIFLYGEACFISCLELFNLFLLCVHTNKYVRDFEMVNDDYSNWYFFSYLTLFSLTHSKYMSVWRKGSICEIYFFLFNNGHHRAAFISGFLQ